MLVPVCEIIVGAGRREAPLEDIKALADSISKIGLLNPITIDQERFLIAGLHRLEAAKLLGWTAIECTVSDLEGLQAEMAEIDENFIRKNLSDAEFRGLLLRRKIVYEKLHPETKSGIAQAVGMNRAIGNNVTAPSAATFRAFVEDTADKLGRAPRTVREDLQIAQNLTPEAQTIIQAAGAKIKKKDTIKLSRLTPEQQEEAARQLVAGTIRSIDKYHAAEPEPEDEQQSMEPESSEESPVPRPVPYSLGNKHFATLEESIADLKDPNKDCHYTLDAMLADIDGFVDRFLNDFEWYTWPVCTEFFPQLSQVQYDFVEERFETISAAIQDLLHMMKKELKK